MFDKCYIFNIVLVGLNPSSYPQGVGHVFEKEEKIMSFSVTCPHCGAPMTYHTCSNCFRREFKSDDYLSNQNPPGERLPLSNS